MSVTALNHVTLAVMNLDRSISFYREELGFRIRAQWARGAYLEAGTFWLCLTAAQDVTPRSDYTHFALSVEEAAFGRLAERFNTLGVVWQDNRSEGASVYFLDPDGHKLEIHVGSLQTRLAYYRAHPEAGVTVFDET